MASNHSSTTNRFLFVSLVTQGKKQMAPVWWSAKEKHKYQSALRLIMAVGLCPTLCGRILLSEVYGGGLIMRLTVGQFERRAFV